MIKKIGDHYVLLPSGVLAFGEGLQAQNVDERVQKWQENIPKNVSLAGDWTQNELPCTIEGSILSGKKAVELLKI